MTRFTAIALVYLLAVPVQAQTCPVLTIYPEVNAKSECISLKCFGLRELRQAYLRGEIRSVHLATRSECFSLTTSDPYTGEDVRVPCTWDENDYYVK